jgi:hypothetical protein
VEKKQEKLIIIISYKTKDVKYVNILVIWRATNWDKEEAKDRNVR